MDRLFQDLRFAARTLFRAPAITAVAVLTLAFGIGANSAVFSLVNTVLIRPLPLVDPDRLVVIHEKRGGSDHGNVSAHEYVAWRDQNRAFDGITMFAYSGFTMTGRGEPVTVTAQTVAANFFQVLGQRALLGRTFQAADDEPGAPRTAILGRALWARQFGSDAGVIGKRVTLDDMPYEIVGVMDTRGDMDSELWVPINLRLEAQKVGKHSNVVVGRLKQGVTMQRGQADLEVVAQRLADQMPGANRGHMVNVASLYEEMVGDVRRPMMIALGSAAFVLLLACANVGHLLLTRAAARQKELAIRNALGAGRSRIVRLLVTEALLLSVAGGIVGLIVAVWITDLLPNLTTAQVPRLSELSVDWRVVSVTAGLCVIAGLACGLIPGLKASAPRLHVWLSEGTRGSAGPGKRVAGVLVVSEIAIALMLLVGAGLTIKSFARLTRIDPGFDARNVLTVALPLPGQRYGGAEQQRRTVTQLVEEVSQAPGVRFAGATTTIPLGPCCNNLGFTIEGRPAPAPGQEIQARFTIASGQYFEAMRIPLRRGRLFAASDRRVAVPLIRWYPEQPAPPRFDEAQAAPVAIINETMAREHWPNEDVLGKRFRIIASPWITIVGVVGDVRQSGMLEPPTPQMYLSDLQEPSGAMTIVIRTDGDPLAVAPSIRQRIRALDTQLPIGAVETMDRVVWNSIGRPRFNALLLGTSGMIAMLLAVIGVYGVISYAVERRTHEIGIRRALGAQTRDVLRLVLGQAAGLVTIGIALGVAGALGLTRVLTTLLYDVRPTDPTTFVLVAALLGGVALLASYVPGRRATRVDPTDALRAE